jgi:hypothetical protein
MTNYCTNVIEVEGSAAELEAFRAACINASGNLDFNAIVPMPEILRGTSKGVGNSFGWDAELGASALDRVQVDFPFGDRVAILEREPVIKAGIRSFEQLEAWLMKHRPNAIKLGARCLEARKQTGYLLERNWAEANWGTHYWEGLAIRQETETRLVAEFATAWAPASGIYHAMARRFPMLAITVSAAEEGNELSYRFSSRDGEITEEEPGLTTEFMEHINGAPQQISDFYLARAELMAEPLTHWRYWPAQRRIGSALRGYPVYRPPHEGIEMLMPEANAQANFDYFMAQRPARIEALQRFLAPFGVPLGFSPAAKSSLDAWLARYGAFLHIREKGSSYDSGVPAWEGARLGLNVIHDVAVFLGDFAIQESPALHWEMYTDVPTGLRTEMETFQKPVIAGFPNNPRWRFYPLMEVHRICHALREESYMWKKPMFRMSPRSLYTRFASKTLSSTYLLARGDEAAANKPLADA